MRQLKYRLWRHNYIIILTSQTFHYHCVEYSKLHRSAKFHDHRSNNNKVMMGDLHVPHDWRFKRSPCQIGLSLYWWTDISTCIWSLFVAFLPLCHIRIYPRKIWGILTYSNDEWPRVIAILFSTEQLLISWSVFCIPQPAVDILDPCLERKL